MRRASPHRSWLSLGVHHERWARWFLPLMMILVVLAFALLVPPVLLFHWE
jgi:hypothetical protein